MHSSEHAEKAREFSSILPAIYPKSVLMQGYEGQIKDPRLLCMNPGIEHTQSF
jgi:hypothetical protein